MKTLRKLSVSFSLSIEDLNFINDRCKELGLSSSDYMAIVMQDVRLRYLDQQIIKESAEKIIK